MKDTGKRLKTVVAALLFLVTSCQKEVVPEEPRAEAPIEEQGSQASELELGEQLENPYSVANMQKALASLQKSKKHAEAAKRKKIKATHLYIKFSPKTEKELDLLKQDSTLILYDYPLDRDITKQGDSYRDPTVPKDRPTPQYTAVPVDKALPGGVRHKVLEKLYIPDGDGDVETTGKGLDQSSKTFIYDLVDESLKLTNNLDEEELAEPLSARRRKWTPAGTIRVFDATIRRAVPVIGVKVRARRWFTTYIGITNSTGRYSADGRFRRKANYSIKWDRYEFSVLDGNIAQAYSYGPKRRGDWNVDITDRPGTYFALIFQGAFDFYYGPRFGLLSPPTNATFKKQMKISAIGKSDVSSYSKYRGLIFSDIRIKTYYKTADTYTTTTHELAHAVHSRKGTRDYNHLVTEAWVSPCVRNSSDCDNPSGFRRNKRRFMETWAETVGIAFATQRYQTKYKVPSWKYSGQGIQNTISRDKSYTSAGWDLIDDNNQYRLDNNYPNDMVSGFTLKQLENALRGARSWENWRDNIKRERGNNATIDRQVDILFAYWNDN